jgi:hypothetical protein
MHRQSVIKDALEMLHAAGVLRVERHQDFEQLVERDPRSAVLRRRGIVPAESIWDAEDESIAEFEQTFKNLADAAAKSRR